jgi:hypothetical protein
MPPWSARRRSRERTSVLDDIPARADTPPGRSAIHHELASAAFRRVLFRVLAVQVLSLLALWLLQARYDR